MLKNLATLLGHCNVYVTAP